MKKYLPFFLFFLFCALLSAAVGPNDNILSNGELKTDRTDAPPLFWGITSQTAKAEYFPNGGPDNKPYIRMYNDGPADGIENTFRQLDLRLVAGEPYKLSAWVKARNYNCTLCGISICNAGWTNFTGLRPENGTYDWTYLEREFTMMDSADKTYFAAIFANNFSGEICVADIRLTALSEAARKGSSAPQTTDIQSQPLMVPWEPLLQQIPEDNPTVSFHFYGKLAELDKTDLVVATSDTDTTVAQPLVDGVNTLRLPEGARNGSLTVILRNREDGSELYGKSHPFALVSIPTVKADDQKRLNNLCTEILNVPLAATTEEQRFAFGATRTGWLFIAAQNAAAENLEVVLDDALVVIQNGTPRLESFREVAVGSHTLAVRNATAGGRLIVRAIAETLTYCPCTDSYVKENPSYDWNFHAKYSFPAVTSQNGGSLPEDKIAWFHEQGYHWIANQMSTKLMDDHDLTRRLDESTGMIDPRYDGVTCDEQFFFQPAMLLRYTRGFHDYTNPNNRMIYSWIVGKPATPGIDQDYISETLNASSGRGRLLLEAYCHTGETEADANRIIDSKIVDNTAKICDAFPNVLPSFGVILGNFNQLPIISLHHHPEVDMKYFLDMQLNRVANDPFFKGLGTVGYWGGYYADHEFHRWSYMLLRHYVVEGKTTMLSDEYGFTYRPGIVVNGDFQNGFEGWRKSGNISTDKAAGFAARSEIRWGGNNGVGDTFAVFAKKGAEVSTLTQTARKLVPGKAYVLQFCTFNVDDIRQQRTRPADFGIRATLGDGAEIRKDLSWQHTHDCKALNCREHSDGTAMINLHHIVFIATKETVEITLDNQLAKAGEQLGVNFFSVLPFLLEE